MKNDFAVIGVGRYGRSLVETLAARNQKIIVIDKNEEAINEVADYIYAAIKIDSTNASAIQNSGIEDVDYIIVAINDLKISVLTCINILDLIKNKKNINVLVRASDRTHARVLNSIGINSRNIILPEREAGRRTALRCMYKLGIEITEMGESHLIIKCDLINPKLHGLNVQDLPLKNIRAVIIAIKRQGRIILPQGSTPLNLNDEIFVICQIENSTKVYNYFHKVN